MLAIKHLVCYMKDEIEGVKQYSIEALKYKTSRPELAQVYHEAAKAEMEHFNKLHEQTVKLADEAEKSGKILEFNKNSFLISAKNGAVSILEIQKEGKKVMPIKDFYNGNVNNFKVNDTIND